MNANRVTGPGSPDSNKPLSQQAQREATQRVEKVREVDPDEQARQQRFQQMMEDTSEEESEIVGPSPFESDFYLSDAKGNTSPSLGKDQVPSPSYSQPPNVSSSNEEETLPDQDLPQSDKFWKKVDLPDQPPGKPIFKETSSTKGNPKTGAALPVEKKQKGALEPSPFGPPGKPMKTGKPTAAPISKKKPEEEVTPSGRYWTPEGEKPAVETTHRISGKEPPKERKVGGPRGEESEEEKQVQPPPLRDFSAILEAEKRKEKEDKGRDQKKKTIDVASLHLPDVPTNVQPMAIAALTNASPYLRPETMTLFYQMVGTLFVMSAPPGISRTEILLNSPAFANSKFFGATIELTRYSTAPDSFNIRLTGSNEAVATFMDNIPSLMAAFQTGNFSFRIGRLDAAYTMERPVFHRKESKGGGEGGQTGRERGK